jgi:hypothetical protein
VVVVTEDVDNRNLRRSHAVAVAAAAAAAADNLSQARAGVVEVVDNSSNNNKVLELDLLRPLHLIKEAAADAEVKVDVAAAREAAWTEAWVEAKEAAWTKAWAEAREAA